VSVTPAQAGAQNARCARSGKPWVPAFAGTTKLSTSRDDEAIPPRGDDERRDGPYTTVLCRAMQVSSTSPCGRCHQLPVEKISTSL
jgi:hypothetical protein